MKIIYILGYGHSGSTLLNLILGTSPNAFSVGELAFLKNRVLNLDNKFRKRDKTLMCTCGKAFSECDFWEQITKNIPIKDFYKEKVSTQNILNLYMKILKNELHKENNLKDSLIYKRIAKTTQSEFIIDSSKNLNRLMHLKYHFNPKVIYLVRDGRAVINSMEKRNVFWLKTYFIWLINNILMNKYIKKLPKKDVITISYDKFAQNPEKYLKQINEKFGTQVNLNNYINDVNKTTYHNFAGNGMRNKKLESISYDQSWKRKMPKWKQYVLTLLCYIPNKMWVYNKK